LAKNSILKQKASLLKVIKSIETKKESFETNLILIYPFPLPYSLSLSCFLLLYSIQTIISLFPTKGGQNKKASF
jgi:hypothetical protein